MPDTILIVDDDTQLTSFLKRFFEKQGFHAATAASGMQMRNMLDRQSFSLIVLDLNLPDMDGFDIARELRADSPVPLIMLTARDEVYDRIIGLELGADDYVTKPFEPRELLARVKAVLRRLNPPETGRPTLKTGHIRFEGLTLDLAAQHLTRDAGNEAVPLTGMEYALLSTLAQHPGETLSRARILDGVYGRNANVTDRAIDAHIARLRRKLSYAGAPDDLIRTVHGTGYLLATTTSMA